MRAGEHDRVGAAPVLLDEAGLDLLRDQRIRDRAVVELCLRERRQPHRADERDIAAVGEIANERAGVFAGNGGSRAEHGDPPAHRARAGRFDCRYRADERHRKARAQMRQDQSGRGVAGNDDEIGTMAFDQFAHQCAHPRDERRLAVVAVRKVGVVRHVHVAGIRPRLRDLAKDGEAPQPRIEDENGWWHAALLKKNCGCATPAALSSRPRLKRVYARLTRDCESRDLRSPLARTPAERAAPNQPDCPNTRRKIVSTCCR